MQVPVELIVWIGGGIFIQLSVCVHILLTIKSRISNIDTKQALQEQEMRFIKDMFAIFNKANVNANQSNPRTT